MRRTEDERTIGSDRLRITHNEDGTKTIAHLVLGGEAGIARRKGKPIFESIATIEVPPAFVDWISDKFALTDWASVINRELVEALASYHDAGAEKTVELLGSVARLVVEATYADHGSAEQRRALIGATVRLLTHLQRTRKG